MIPDTYEISPAGRRRLTGFMQERRYKWGRYPWVRILAGGMLMAAGIAAILAGSKVLHVVPASAHVPLWMLTAVGVFFALGGLADCRMARKQLKAILLRREAICQHPGEPALADYPWYPDGFAVSRWAGAAKPVAVAILIPVVLAILNWGGFFPRANGMSKVAVIVNCSVTLFFFCWASWQVARALKFGHSRIEFTSFPCRLSEPVVIRWQPFRGINRVKKGTFTLRCVAEWWERYGRGENQSAALVHEETWSAKWILEQPRDLDHRDDVELRYELPPDAPPTNLSAAKPIFWELEVKLDLPGMDFHETYLVPVYGPAQTATVATAA